MSHEQLKLLSIRPLKRAQMITENKHKIKHIFLISMISALMLHCADRSASSNLDEADMAKGMLIPEEFDGSVIYYPDMASNFDPCDPNPCVAGSRCEAVEASTTDQGLGYQCLSLGCDELDCGEGSQCVEDELGAICVDQGCLSAADCEGDEYCDAQGECQADVCIANERRCDEAEIILCAPDGSSYESWLVCPLGPSQCLDAPPGEASCACHDDWDCPEYLRCERGICLGRPEAPTCLLPPQPFSESLPAPEIIWGGTAESPNAEGSPFPESSQAVMTPLVANLTDDNGDGLIDEGDRPEIIFMTFCNRDFRNNGTLRAIHGGGPSRGRDLFTSVGDAHWYEGDELESFTPSCESAILDSTAGIAVANLDPIGGAKAEPEIVGIHENGGIVIYDHRGEIAALGFLIESPNVGPNPTPSIAQLDGSGMAEIIVSQVVYTLRREGDELIVVDQFVGTGARGTNGQGGVSCVADLDGDGRQEIIAGGTAYRYPVPPRGAQQRADCVSNGGAVDALTREEDLWCRGELDTLWVATEVNSGRPAPLNAAPTEGFCAIADIWGADPNEPPSNLNPLDGQAEVIIIVNGDLVILDGSTGTMLYRQRYGATSDRGGAPNVGDFDGDGFPEVGAAFSSGYVMMDLQATTEACPAWDSPTPDEEANGVFGRPERSPGGACERDADCATGALCKEQQCICGHQGWQRSTEDNSSKVTGSTLFDFNGDGALEVIYNDECFFRIYDGSTGRTLFRQPSESRTRIEHPVVADVDADGNAEIVFTTSTESGFCSVRNQTNLFGETYASLYNPGLEVWGDPRDLWVSARKIWSQHAYHVTHITESGQVPESEPRGWRTLRGRQYNSYRAQPLAFGIAPDLKVERLRASLNRGRCGASESDQSAPLNISVTIENDGEVQVAAGLEVALSARWTEGGPFSALLDPDGEPLSLTTNASILAGTKLTLTARYDAARDPSMPSVAFGVEAPLEIKAIVDPIDLALDSSFGRERECIEDNNERSTLVEVSEQSPDLRLSLNEVEIDLCPDVRLQLTLYNEGSAPVTEAEIGLYLGDPSAGGSRIDTKVIQEEIPAFSSIEIEWASDRFPEYREAQLFAIIDPANRISECDESNNVASSEGVLSCRVPDGQ